MKGSNALITGGMGFIGSNLAIELVKKDVNVTIIDSMIPQYGGNEFNIQPIRDKIKINYSDIRDEHSLKHLVRGHDYIFNLAGNNSDCPKIFCKD